MHPLLSVLRDGCAATADRLAGRHMLISELAAPNHGYGRLVVGPELNDLRAGNLLQERILSRAESAIGAPAMPGLG